MSPSGYPTAQRPPSTRGKPTAAPIDSKVEEVQFLEGPKSRRSEALRVMRIAEEFIRGFRALHFLGPTVTVFGSARLGEDSEYYGLSREMGRRLAKSGFAVMTGGGPGLMEAANRGAKDVGGVSIGSSIRLPHEQDLNQFLDVSVDFRYFFVRKVMLVKYSSAFVVMPGGFGTMDEIFETATLIQTRTMQDFPIVCMGTRYWSPLFDFIRESMIPVGTVSSHDIDLLTLTDSPDEAIRAVLK